MRLTYGFLPFRLIPKTVVIPLIFLFFVGMGGAANIDEAFLKHSFFDSDTWWIPVAAIGLYNLCLLAFLKPVLQIANCCEKAPDNVDGLARTALLRFQYLPWFTILLSVAFLFACDGLTALRQNPSGSFTLLMALKGMVDLSAGFFLGVLVQFFLENTLFPAKRLVRQYAPQLPLPYQSLYFKIFLVLAAVTIHLVVQTLAVLPSFIILDRPAGGLPLLDGAAGKDSYHWMRKNAEVLFNAAHYGAKEALEVFSLQMAAYLAFIVLMVTQIKLLIKKPLATINSRLRDLRSGRTENLNAIDVVQNDEFASAFTEINRLIESQKTALEASEERLSHIVAGAADPIIVFDQTGAIRLFNPAAEAFFGYDSAEAQKLAFGSLVDLPEKIACDCKTTAMPLIHYLLEESSRLARHQGIRKDGTRRPFESNISATETPEGPLFTAILRDISAQLTAEENLKKAKTTAENANRMKSEFLANMSHELRTPLNAVLGFTQLLSNDKNLTEGQLNKIEIISRSGEHLLALINDILDISKIEAGKFDMHPTVFDLEAFVGDLRDMFDLRCRKKGLSLDVEMLDGLPRYVRGDLGKLRQVMINLVGNAVKFTAEGGIGIVAGPEGDRIRFSVNDSGKGIPEADMDLIMQPFMQSSNADNEGGTGLGLTISRRFIDLMGGSLTVESKVGEGSTFSFAVPLERTDDAPEGPEPELKAVAVKEGSAVLALIVDDKTTNRLILKEMLERVGFGTIEAENGQEAVDRAREFRPRIVFMDIKMPVLDGYGAVGRMKADPELAAVPVFALTASAFKHDEERIRAAGFDGFLAKPFKQSSLFRLIRDKTSIRLEYETPEEERKPGPEAACEEPGTVRARLGDEGLAKLDDMTVINDFTAVKNFAESIKSDLPGFASRIIRYASAFDEASLAELISSVRGSQEIQ